MLSVRPTDSEPSESVDFVIESSLIQTVLMEPERLFEERRERRPYEERRRITWAMTRILEESRAGRDQPRM
jgi:hypothetical protein